MPDPEDYRGYFINLDRSTQRRAETEAELHRHGLMPRYERFAGVEGNALQLPNPHNLSAGVLGCFTSHYLLLKQNLKSTAHLHVIEDEVLFAACTERVIRWVIASGYLDEYDILYTDISVPLRNEVHKLYKTAYDKAVQRDEKGAIQSVAFDVLDVRNRTYASTSSFLVNRHSIQKIHDIFEKELLAGTGNPVDLIIRDKNHRGVLKVGCIFPFVTSVRPGATVFFQRSISALTASQNLLSILPAQCFLSKAIGRNAKLTWIDMHRCPRPKTSFHPC